MIKISGKYDSEQVAGILKDYAAKRKENIVKKEYYDLIFPDAHKIYDLENVITDIGTQKRLVVDEAQSIYPQFVLTGDPGSGKSTLLFNLYLKLRSVRPAGLIIYLSVGDNALIQ